ncbi:MAG: MBL fold metallo-hydrolase [bacterium]
MKISFFGGAGQVTGSCSLVETNGKKILLDCGMFQGSHFNEDRNQDPLPFDPKELSAVLVTHAHLDHVGRLPLLSKGGYEGRFYANPATVDLAQYIMEDAHAVMTENNRKYGTPILYDISDVANVEQQFKKVEYYEEIAPDHLDGVKIKFYDAGHIFGSAFIEIQAEGKKIVFSGDVGNTNVPILRETDSLPDNLDALVCESTYGNRVHETTKMREQIILGEVSEAVKAGGVLMIPAFSLERTQELLYELHELIDRKKLLPRIPIFLDSPLAIRATTVYRKYPKYYDEIASRIFKEGDDMFRFPGLKMCETREESKQINSIHGPKIIIAGSGMMNGGRIQHHAMRYLPEKSNTLLIVGYQAEGTVGRQILNGSPYVKIFGDRIPVRCQVRAIGALSAHADQKKLVRWIGEPKNMPKNIFLNHGEPDASSGLAVAIKDGLDVNAQVVTEGLIYDF